MSHALNKNFQFQNLNRTFTKQTSGLDNEKNESSENLNNVISLKKLEKQKVGIENDVSKKNRLN